jgi:hypothetical protein
MIFNPLCRGIQTPRNCKKKMLGISEGTSKSQLTHARKILQKQITTLKKL